MSELDNNILKKDGPWDDLDNYIKKAKGEVKEAKEKVESHTDINLIKQDTGYLKWNIYILGAILILALTAGWHLYLHIDRKLENKIDYLNLRIDKIISEDNLK